METQEKIRINFKNPWEYFAVRYYGDSMSNVGMRDEALLIVHKQQQAEDGDIVVALHNGEAHVRYYKKVGETEFLVAGNNKDLPIAIASGDEFKILGRVAQLQVSF